MTSPLVNPVPGYNTLSRLDSVSVRPSTCTATFADSRLTDHLVRRLVRAQPAPRWMAQPTLAGPLGEHDLADELRCDPLRILGMCPRHRHRERRHVARERTQVVLQVTQ